MLKIKNLIRNYLPFKGKMIRIFLFLVKLINNHKVTILLKSQLHTQLHSEI